MFVLLQSVWSCCNIWNSQEPTVKFCVHCVAVGHAIFKCQCHIESISILSFTFTVWVYQDQVKQCQDCES